MSDALEGVTCGVTECGRPACRFFNAINTYLCSGHTRRFTLGLRLTKLKEAQGSVTPKRDTWLRLTNAALTYADVDSEDDEAFHRACQQLQKAAQAYARAHPVPSAPPALTLVRPSAPRTPSLLAG